MSDRLIRRAEENYLRAMQMSSAQIMVFVEGKDFDEYFYGNICQAINGRVINVMVQESKAELCP